jgi:pSer/pThr/pTyr-binding forkhead associated (FHA) protein
MPQIIVTLGDNVVNKYVFDKDIMSIGRARDNDIVIENLAISRNHARIRRDGDRFFLSDLNSANGTYLNDERITKAELADGDTVSIGKHKLIFRNEAVDGEALISDAFGAERTVLVTKAPLANLVVTRGKQKDTTFQVDKADVTIGRGGDCEICLRDWFVSKQHAIIHRQGNTFLLRDMGSWRGTKVNDVQITETVLKNGDLIQIGGTYMTFHVSEHEIISGVRRAAPALEKIEPVPPRPVPPRVEKRPLEPVKPVEEEPIRAGGAEDFIEPSVHEPLDFLHEDVRVEPEAPLEEEVLPADTQETGRDLGQREAVVEEVAPPPSAEMPADTAKVSKQFTPEPFAVEPSAAEPSVMDEYLAEPTVTEPSAPEPVAAEPSFAEPAAAEPVAAEPFFAEPAAAEPVAAEPFFAEPAAAGPPAAESFVSEPVAAEPAAEPAVESPVEPATAEAVAQEPRRAEPSAAPQEHLDEIRMWEDARKNKSAVIRKQALKMLKKLTGRDYDN